jgi:hypothetical protein
MRRISFDTSNDWDRHLDLQRPVTWRTSSGENCIVFESEVEGSRWTIRLNDFPDEPCHTLLINGDEVMQFDDWPSIWERPEFPKTTTQSHEN